MEKLNCGCGFSWVKGFTGQHNCSPYYRETIESLKSELEQHDDQITNIEIANQEMLAVADTRINKLVNENNDLKAQVERYQKLVCQTCDGHGAVGNILDSMDCPDCLSYEKRVQAEAVDDFCKSGVSPNAKAGCIGDFSVTTVQTCPECWREQDDYCELCNGETDENGHSDLEVVVPWTTQKEIFSRMLDFKQEYHANKLSEAKS